MFNNEYTLEEYEAESGQAIEQLLNTKTRQILEEVKRSDIEAGEYDTGILAGIYAELV